MDRELGSGLGLLLADQRQLGTCAANRHHQLEPVQLAGSWRRMVAGQQADAAAASASAHAAVDSVAARVECCFGLEQQAAQRGTHTCCCLLLGGVAARSPAADLQLMAVHPLVPQACGDRVASGALLPAPLERPTCTCCDPTTARCCCSPPSGRRRAGRERQGDPRQDQADGHLGDPHEQAVPQVPHQEVPEEGAGLAVYGGWTILPVGQ